MILSIFYVAQMIFAPLNSSIKRALGAKNTLLAGFAILTLATFGLGAIARVSDPHWFKYLAVALRFIHGIGCIILQVTSYSIATAQYPDDLV